MCRLLVVRGCRPTLARFRFFECWETEEAFNAHQAQPYELEFHTDHVSRIVGADAHVLDIAGRRSVTG